MRHSTCLHPSRAGVGSTLLFAFLLFGFGSCASTASDKEIDPAEDETFRPLGPASRINDSMGKYLADLSSSIKAWNEKTLTAATTQERTKQSLLEINISERVHLRHAEILGELENGPERNRIIAAAALGFSGDSSDLSPLLAALDDRNPLVVSNALLGLGTLASPETPLHRVGELMRYSLHPKTRWSAADCALSLIASGANSDGILEPARAGLTDAEEPMVRAQSALILCLIADTDSIEALGNLLFDEVPIVSVSAAKSLAYIGTENPQFAAPAARALYRGMVEGERNLQLRVHPSMVKLSQKDYGLQLDEWAKWISKLP